MELRHLEEPEPLKYQNIISQWQLETLQHVNVANNWFGSDTSNGEVSSDEITKFILDYSLQLGAKQSNLFK